MLEAITQRFSPQLQSGLASSIGSGSFRQGEGGLLGNSPQLGAGVHHSASAPSGVGRQPQLPTADGGGGGGGRTADVEQQ